MTNRKFTVLLFFLSLELTARPVLAQEAYDFSSFERAVSAELDSRNIPGVAVAVVHDGRVALQRGFGVSDLETGKPVRPEMLFQIASATKMFTSAALITLVEEGKIDLNVAIGKYTWGSSIPSCRK